MENNSKIFVLLLKEIAESKLGVGYQSQLAKLTGLKQSNISRMFSLKYTPTLDTFVIVTMALNLNHFFEDKDNKTDLRLMMKRAVKELEKRNEALPNN